MTQGEYWVIIKARKAVQIEGGDRMAFNYDYLRIFIKENYGTINKFAEFLGIGTTQMYERLGNRVPFTQKEIDKVANESKAEPLPPQEIYRLFFTK